MWLKVVWVCLFLSFAQGGEHFSALKDDISFRINWPGADANLGQLAPPGIEYDKEDTFIITSSDNERYRCTIPSMTGSHLDNSAKEAEKLQPPHEILAPLFKLGTCTYRIEAYWSYEICHGKHIRQYHEEKVRTNTAKQEPVTVTYETEDGKKIVLQNDDDTTGTIKTTEFFLGYLSDKIDKNGYLLKPEAIPMKPEEVTYRRIRGVKTPFFAVNMTDGTPCDLKSGAGRKSTVLYVCGPNSYNEIISISETSSCEYELIVLSPELCTSPLFDIKGKRINDVQCVAMDDAPIKPQALIKFSQDQPKDSQHTSRSRTSSDSGNVDDTPVKDSMHKVTSSISTLVDKSLLRDFLSGTYCLQGKSGWWRFEYCYGKQVTQYHDDAQKGRTTILVGKWDLNEHIKWTGTKNSKPRAYKTEQGQSKVSMVAHFYGNGEICDKTGRPREVVVQMKCKRKNSSPHSVTLYLLEPKTCSYILGIESLIVCDLLDSADEYGILAMDP